MYTEAGTTDLNQKHVEDKNFNKQKTLQVEEKASGLRRGRGAQRTTGSPLKLEECVEDTLFCRGKLGTRSWIVKDLETH